MAFWAAMISASPCGSYIKAQHIDSTVLWTYAFAQGEPRCRGAGPSSQFVPGLHEVLDPAFGQVWIGELFVAVRNPMDDDLLQPLAEQRAGDRVARHRDRPQRFCRRRRNDIDVERVLSAKLALAGGELQHVLTGGRESGRRLRARSGPRKQRRPARRLCSTPASIGWPGLSRSRTLPLSHVLPGRTTARSGPAMTTGGNSGESPASITRHWRMPVDSPLESISSRSRVVCTSSKVVVLYWFALSPRPLAFLTGTSFPPSK